MVFQAAQLHKERMHAIVHPLGDESRHDDCMRGRVTHWNVQKENIIIDQHDIQPAERT